MVHPPRYRSPPSVEILSNDVWSTITKHAKNSLIRHVAVAYLQNRANRLLPLREGDSLVLDMSDSSVMAGRTNPYEVDKYRKKGVKTFNCPNLHAKVFVFDETTIIGSTNVSKNSEEYLVEAAMLCQDKHVALKTIKWLKSLQKEEITPEHIKHCKEIYNPPEWIERKPRVKGLPDFSTLWILSTAPYDPSDEDNKIRNEIESELAKKVDLKKYELVTIRWTDNPRITERISQGNLVVEISDNNTSKIRINPPSYLKRITNYRSHNGEKWVFFTLERPKHLSRISWNTFSMTALEAGLRLSRNSNRKVPSGEAKNAILDLWKGTEY